MFHTGVAGFRLSPGYYLCCLMRIAIDVSNKEYGLTPNEILYLDKCFQLLLSHHPEHEWIFDPFRETKGVISLLPVGIKKSMILDKLNLHALITAGRPLKKPGTKFRRLFFLNQQSEFNKKNGDVLQQQDLIITTSEVLKKRISKTHSIEDARIKVIAAAPSEDISLADWSEKLAVKDRYADGREFFLCFKQIGPASQWEEVLKAFSIFKKWQQSSFRLLMAGKVEDGYREEFTEKFGSYKYRNDVKVLDPDEEDIDRALSTAFGLISADSDYTGLNLLNGFMAEVPVISSPQELFDEEVSGAFLPAIPLADELSRQLINLYRDEQLRDALVQKGKTYIEKFSWKKSEDMWFDAITDGSD